MTQQEEQAASGALDVEDFLYHRMGYVDQGRKSDSLLAVFLGLLPGDGRLPLRWHYRSHERFLEKHGHLGNILWAASNNSHLLMMYGFHALRIWHDTAKTCYVEIADNLYGNLGPQLTKQVESIPEKNWKKSKPFTKRIQVWQQWQMQALYEAVKRTYGLHRPTF
jgi:hypothetical protein